MLEKERKSAFQEVAVRRIIFAMLLIIFSSWISIITFAGNEGAEFNFTEPPSNYMSYKCKPLKNSKPNAGIENISISKNKNIAVAFRDGSVIIFGPTGEYAGGFSFDNSGSFIVNYSEEKPENLEILVFREDAAYIVNESGHLIETKGWDIDNGGNRDLSWYCVKHEFIIDKETYKISNAASWPIIMDAGSKVTKIDAQNNEITIYCNEEYPIIVTINTALVALAFITTLFIMYKQGFRQKEEGKYVSSNKNQ